MGLNKALLVALAVAIPLLGHHSFQVRFDEKRGITLSGTITKVMWQNPHVHVDIDAKGEAGTAGSWELELDSPNMLMSQGWKIDSLRIGDQVTASGFPARNGSKVLSAKKITLTSH
jgi:hypothetical protein